MTGPAVVPAVHKNALGYETLVGKFVQGPSVACAVHLHSAGMML